MVWDIFLVAYSRGYLCDADLRCLLSCSRCVHYMPNARALLERTMRSEEMWFVQSTIIYFLKKPLRWPGFFTDNPIGRVASQWRFPGEDILEKFWASGASRREWVGTQDDWRAYDRGAFLRRIAANNAGLEDVGFERLASILSDRQFELAIHYYGIPPKELIGTKRIGMFVALRRPFWTVCFGKEDIGEVPTDDDE